MLATPTADRSEKELVVLNAATSLFLTHGFSATTTDMIQREAGVSKATMYACFPDKEALFAAVIERQCAFMSSSIQAIEASPEDVVKMLTDVGRSYIQTVLSPAELALYRVVTAEAPRFPDLGRRFYLAGPKAVTSLVAARLKNAAEAGEVNVQAIGVDAAAGLFISMVRGEGQLEAMTHPDSQPSVAQMYHWVQVAVTTFLGAFAAKQR
ncbi:TPA: TetR/AcrR family transcriptional regulator [Pseudomonas aeruginosa]|uniref:TetR/AcrR family transcriptional regulator n=2 Tax=Pseudomonas aeruginosa TaxID=287 RepID=UPI00071BA07A|nr:TetR/AcrR family transcriptional regulator [Pseudomonas aeruginosa]KSD17489.1 TetR family transcriptional regulator [Pseudomonas aeruginosa]HBO8980212.1 TetR/AcrR family transcriptional regulator [Pseudomonas aeruginosa]HCL3876949.1 TetR/AcrR family transcriptional regulator [Pseudomonas aeruginosa]HDQ4576297.1 TetR/AcrR family transcriptional regulator [Pseudomonas aeruginosa]